MHGAQKTLIITPTYNERDNLPVFVERLFAVLPNADLLVVDDDSPDGTGACASALARANRRVQLLQRPRKQGLGSAYLDAFRHALQRDYAFIFQMDTDLSHDPKHLPELLDALRSGADVVIGSRNVPGGGIEGWGPARRVLSKGGSLYSRMWLGLAISDLTSGFKGFRRRVLQELPLQDVRAEGYAFQVELSYRAARAGFEVTEVPIVFADRRAGKSKMSSRIFAEAVWAIPKLRFDQVLGKL